MDRWEESTVIEDRWGIVVMVGGGETRCGCFEQRQDEWF